MRTRADCRVCSSERPTRTSKVCEGLSAGGAAANPVSPASASFERRALRRHLPPKRVDRARAPDALAAARAGCARAPPGRTRWRPRAAAPAAARGAPAAAAPPARRRAARRPPPRRRSARATRRRRSRRARPDSRAAPWRRGRRRAAAEHLGLAPSPPPAAGRRAAAAAPARTARAPPPHPRLCVGAERHLVEQRGQRGAAHARVDAVARRVAGGCSRASAVAWSWPSDGGAPCSDAAQQLGARAAPARAPRARASRRRGAERPGRKKEGCTAARGPGANPLCCRWRASRRRLQRRVEIAHADGGCEAAAARWGVDGPEAAAPPAAVTNMV